MHNGYVTAEQLLALAGKRAFKDIDIANPFDPLHPLKFRIRTLMEDEWSSVSSGNYDIQRGGLSAEGLRLSDVRLVALCLVDQDGNLLLTGRDAAAKLLAIGTPIIEPLVRECRDLNNLRGLEDTEKNLTAASDWDTNLPGSPEGRKESLAT